MFKEHKIRGKKQRLAELEEEFAFTEDEFPDDIREKLK